jgi:hypothetical protein
MKPGGEVGSRESAGDDIHIVVLRKIREVFV